MATDFDIVGTTLKVGGEGYLAGETEYEHGDEVFVVARVRVNEVAFPEDKDGNVTRQHKAKASEVFVIGTEEAARVTAKARQELTGQGNLDALTND